MNIAAAHADSFIKEVTKSGFVWCIRDNTGFPTSTNASGEKVMPFWSKDSRAQAIIANVPAYQDFETHRLSLKEFLERWLPGMEQDGLFVGVNWSGKRATGYDVSPDSIRARLEVTANK